MIFSIAFIALIVTFSALAIIVSIPPDIAANSADPVYDTLRFHLGETAARSAEVMYAIGFLASFLALQTSASRIIWSYARDRALPASRLLSTLTRSERQPVFALVVATTIGSAIILFSRLAPDLYTLLLNFTSGGFYLAFLFPLVGNLVVRLRGDWQPGPFSFGRWGTPLAVVATVWAALQFLNIAWPRDFYPEAPFLNWSIALAVLALAVGGTAIYLSLRRGITGFAAADLDDEEVSR